MTNYTSPPVTLLEGIYRKVGGTPQVSESNPFVIEYVSSGRVLRTEPNWALIVPLIVIVSLALIALFVYLRYKSWLRNTIPVCFAGKVRRVRPGETFGLLCMDNKYWLEDRIDEIEAKGYEVVALYTDQELKHPWVTTKPVKEPLFIFPKLRK